MPSAPVERVLARLRELGKKVRPSAKGWSAECPAHDDRSRDSLSIGDGGDKVLTHCWAGCTYAEIMAALGLPESAGFADNGNDGANAQGASDDTKPSTVSEYAAYTGLNEAWLRKHFGIRDGQYQVKPCVELPYRDAAGREVLTKKRMGRRKFLWPESVPLMLYGLDYLAGVNGTTPVMVVEGETDVQVLRAHGFVAVGVPGAEGWISEWVSVLEGRQVFVWQEPDKAGAAFAAKVTRDLPTARVITPPAGLKDARDLHLVDREGFTARVTALLEAAQPITTAAADVRESRSDAGTSVAADSEDSGEGLAERPTWEAVIPLGSGDLPLFPSAALPPWLREFAEAEAEATQTPLDLPALLGLGALAASVQRTVCVSVRRDYRESVNVFVAVALPPGTRKSPVFAAAIRPLVEWEQDRWEKTKVEFARKAHERRVLEKRLERAEQEAAKANNAADRQEAENEARMLVQQLAETPKPVRPRLWTDDVTAEALAVLLAEQGGAMSVFAAEGGDLFAIMGGRYSTGSNFGVYLKGHAGDPFRVDRRNAEPIYVAEPALTLAVSMQPAVLHGLHDVPEFRGRGLLARFLYAVPSSPLGRRQADPRGMPEAVERAYATALRELLAAGENDRGLRVPHTLELSDSARERWIAYVRALEPRLGELGDLHAIADWASKLTGAVIRIAGLLHCAKQRAQPWALPIAADTMAEALTIGDYLLAHARGAFRLTRIDEAVVEAEYLWRHIRKRGVPTFTKRDLWQWTKGHYDQVTELDAGLRVLVSHKYVQELPPPTPAGPGRPPSPCYAVNPEILPTIPRNRNSGDSGEGFIGSALGPGGGNGTPAEEQVPLPPEPQGEDDEPDDETPLEPDPDEAARAAQRAGA